MILSTYKCITIWVLWCLENAFLWERRVEWLPTSVSAQGAYIICSLFPWIIYTKACMLNHILLPALHVPVEWWLQVSSLFCYFTKFLLEGKKIELLSRDEICDTGLPCLHHRFQCQMVPFRMVLQEFQRLLYRSLGVVLLSIWTRILAMIYYLIPERYGKPAALIWVLLMNSFIYITLSFFNSGHCSGH
jgi:hypothetical protein